ncbi:MAG: polysaccharide biosynthesis tyrosine autokinase, partial [Proteobacteria bacterium]|nr:polysaccharide biosynthesis tyrosine autokinase [Pseudomonadota bacterium]
FLIEYLDNTIKSPDLIEEYFKLPFLGIIPYIDGNAREKGRHHEISTAVKNKLITQYNPESPIAEAYRVIRTNLQFASIDNPLKSILVTGVQPEDGKTTTVCNIAITYANMGLNTVVVDTDLRKPQVHRMFGMENKSGISNYLIEKNRISDIVHKTNIKNLSIVPAGRIKGNFGEILNSEKMKKFIGSMREKFDIVLYDSPPVLSVADPLILGAQMDGIILVVRYGVTNKDAMMHVKKIISQHSTKLIGVLLNANRNYHSAGYKYYYYDYYSTGKKGKKSIIQKLIERI